MRILKIAFKNINSFRGEHEIDFTLEPLQSTGIFAIIGPTGSGKSTILDALTLALFNQIPRFDKKISRTDVDQSGSVLTHFTDEGYATIEYVSRGEEYRSRWSISRAKTGNLRDYEMELAYVKTGEIIESQKGNIPSLNEKLIGLSYDQFVKSILLSQGEFSKFIKANKNERAKLLEDITGTHIYSKIGAAVYAKAKEVKTNLQLERLKLEGIELLSKEEKSEIQKKITEQEVSLKKVTGSIQVLTKQLSFKTEVLQLTKQLADFSKLLEDLKLERTHFEDDLKKMRKHEKILPLQAEIVKIQGLINNIHNKSESLRIEQQKKKEAEEALTRSIEKMSELVKEDVNVHDFMVKMSKFEKKILAFEENLRQLEKNGVDTRSRIVRASENVAIDVAKELGNPKIDPDRALSLIEARQIKSASVLDFKSHQDLVKHQSSLVQKIGLFQNAEHLKLHCEEISNRIKEVAKLIKEAEATIVEQKKKVKHAKSLADKYKLEILQLRKAKELAHERFKLEDYRNRLKDDEPCPLCGSLDHPYATHVLAEIGAHDIALKEKEKQLELNNQVLNKSANLVGATDEAIRLRNQEQIDLTEAYQKNLKSLKAVLGTLGIKEDITDKELKKKLLLLQEEKELVEKELLNEQERKYLEQVKPEFEQIQKVLIEYQKIKRERLSLYTGDNITDDVNLVQNEFAEATQALKTSEALISGIQKELDKARKDEINERKKVEPKLSSIGYDDISSVQKDLLTEEVYLEFKRKSEGFSSREIKLKTEHQRLTAQLTKLDNEIVPKESLDNLQSELIKLEQERDMSNELKGALQNRLTHNEANANRHLALLKEIERKEKDAEKWMILDQYIGDSTGSKFSNFAQDLTLSNLIAIANGRLKKLSDRYILSKPDDASEMRVIDTYQGNSSRVIKTLSGGETFLISLSLALSLSDLASKNVRLDSLFIDEGFGTLDQETLDIALSTLESLQSESNKTIGVISHVEALKERIHTQIQLKKNAQGFSSINITNARDNI